MDVENFTAPKSPILDNSPRPHALDHIAVPAIWFAI
jgi:hypothetical protein